MGLPMVMSPFDTQAGKTGLSTLVGILTSMPPRERAEAAWLLVEDGTLLEELFDEERHQKEAGPRERSR
jgi:hypothetical protein